MKKSKEFWEGFDKDGIDGIYMDTPNNKVNSGEDSSDESGEMLDDSSGKQLQASAKVDQSACDELPDDAGPTNLNGENSASQGRI